MPLINRSKRTTRSSVMERQAGSSMVEFVIVTPMLMFMGLGIMQFGLIYHAKSILNYATFEAARTGAVNNAQIEVMRKELGYRLAPVYGGDGSLKMGAMSLARSVVAVNDITATKIKLINPTPASFGAHGINKSVEDRHGATIGTVVIPNSHVRFNNEGEKGDGLNLKDANLLKIEVTYGYQMRLPFLDMKMPGVAWITRNLMIRLDRDNWMYYVRGMIPLKATATVRMQSEAWEYQEDPPVVRAFEAAYAWVKDQIWGNNDTPGECETTGNSTPAPTDPNTGVALNSPVQTASSTSCTAPPVDTNPFGDNNKC